MDIDLMKLAFISAFVGFGFCLGASTFALIMIYGVKVLNAAAKAIRAMIPPLT